MKKSIQSNIIQETNQQTNQQEINQETNQQETNQQKTNQQETNQQETNQQETNQQVKANKADKVSKAGRKKKKHHFFLIFLAVVVVIWAGSHLYTKIVKPAKIEGFEAAVATIDGIKIPEGVRIVGLGEASHGNKEFQELKLEVFRQLVATTNIRALILEGDIGGCELANQYIQGGEGTAEEVTRHLGYRIYRTDQMRDLVQWMHDYNEAAADEDKVRLYGMDMQYDEDMIAVINSFYAKADAAKGEAYAAKVRELLGESDDDYDASRYDEIVALMDEIEKDVAANEAAYAERTSAFEAKYVAHMAENVKYFISYRVKEKRANRARDSYMKENVDWILAMEESERGGAVMVSCHNGHMARNQYSPHTFLGMFLAEDYGKKYFAIGTDFYNTSVNLPTTDYSGRIIKEFCSDDALAYQVKDLPGNVYYLDFSKVDAGSALGKKIGEAGATGSLSEAYSWVYKVLKSSYQVFHAPTDMYDAMILYYETTPIEIWEK